MRAEYGTRLIASLADDLTKEFGSGYNKRNLAYYRQFYLTFNDLELEFLYFDLVPGWRIFVYWSFCVDIIFLIICWCIIIYVYKGIENLDPDFAKRSIIVTFVVNTKKST
ncbi:MAG: hypothetical protein K2K05_11605 [Muribaculaceae bacterium]|nr:hypothetical protein [Muribaculaceae bacterium]